MDFKEAKQILDDYNNIQEYDYDLSLTAVGEIDTLVTALGCMYNEVLRLQKRLKNEIPLSDKR